MPPPLNELACYGLAGAAASPRDLLDEVAGAEALGLGSMFLSERFNVKEAVTLSGAAAAVSSTIGIATGVTNHNTRHPMVTASFATTMHRLSEGRFALGLGRGVALLQDLYGLSRVTSAQMEDFVGLMRRLWHGEMIFDHHGPAGTFPFLHLDAAFDDDIPVMVSAFGPHTLDLGGRVFDGVILHTFFTDETTRRCVDTVRRAAEQAGRDPARVRIWSCYATVGDHIPEDLRLRKTVGRLSGYLQGYGDLMVETNGWDPAVLQRFRADEVVRSIPGAIDGLATVDQLEHIATLIPDEWLASAATGSPEQCAAAVARQFDLGVDGVILHGATPAELGPVVTAYRDRRPAGRYEGLAPNPGA